MQEEVDNMREFMTFHLQPIFLLTILSLCLATSAAKDALTGTCGQIPIQEPFSIQTYNLSSPLNHMLLCKWQKLYFRTSLGLFPISSINYTAKVLTISHPSCSHSKHYISPVLLSAGFPTPPQSNSLLLFNCSNSKNKFLPFVKNFTCSQACEASKNILGKEERRFSNCLVVNNLEELGMGFHPRDLNCSHYSRVYKKSSDDHDDEFKGFELGTRISFGIPDHVPTVCNKCEKPNGNCGIGLRCICHAQECKDKAISKGGSIDGVGNILVSISFLVMMVL